MVADKLLVVAAVDGIHSLVTACMHGEVITHTASDKRFLHPGESVHSMVYIEKRRMVIVEIGTRLGMQTARTHALVANSRVLSSHTVHIGRRPSEIGNISFEIMHLRNFADFLQYRLLAARCDELSLVRRDGAESASAEASAVHVHRMPYHLVGRYPLPFITRMRQTGICHVKRLVDLLGCHGREHRVHFHHAVAVRLPQCGSMPSV